MDLPPKLRKGDNFPTADWFNKLVSAIEARTILSTPNAKPTITQAGTMLSVAPQVAQTQPTITECRLGKMLVNKDDSAKRDLSSGTISGGGSSYSIGQGSIDNLGVAMTPTANQYVYAKGTWLCIVTDDVLMGGGELTALTIDQGSSVPANDYATTENLTINFYICLGWWYKPDPTQTAISWRGSACGSIDVAFCHGNNQVTYIRE